MITSINDYINEIKRLNPTFILLELKDGVDIFTQEYYDRTRICYISFDCAEILFSDGYTSDIQIIFDNTCFNKIIYHNTKYTNKSSIKWNSFKNLKSVIFAEYIMINYNNFDELFDLSNKMDLFWFPLKKYITVDVSNVELFGSITGCEILY